MALMRDLVDAIAGTRLPITYAFHDPTTLDGSSQQPHLHLLISARQNDAHARTAATHFKRYNREHPERGGAQKDDAFRHRGAIKAHRVLISDIVNVHLEYAGLAARVHPDVWKTPGRPHARAKAAPQREPCVPRTGDISARMQEVLDIRQERASQGREGTGAGADVLGRTEGRTRDHGCAAHGTQTLCNHRSTGTARDHPPVRPVMDLDKRWKTPLIGNRLSQIYHTPDQNSYGNVAPKNQVRFRTEREAQQAGYRRAANDHYGPGTGVAQTATRAGGLAGEFQRLTRLMDPEDGRGHGDLNVRLHAEERDRDRGMSW